ncbi:MAG: hypothetical protein ACSHX8_14535 [Opitutaceae bacterium]
MAHKNLTIQLVWASVAATAFGIGFMVGGSDQNEPVSSAQSEPLVDITNRVDSREAIAEGRGLSVAETEEAVAELMLEDQPSQRPGLSLEDIETLSRQTVMDPSPLRRSLAMSKLLDQIDPSNALIIQQQLEEMGAGGDEMRLFQYAWGEIDGAAATQYALSIENEDQRENFLHHTVSGWASSDPGSAIAFARTQDSGDRDDHAMRGLIEGLSDYNIDYATNFIYQLANEGDERTARFLSAVSNEALRSGGVVGATRWGDALQDGAAKASVLDQIANRYVREDPEAAARWVSQYANQEYAARVIEEVGDEWAERDPVNAVAWLETIPEGPGKEQAMRSALNEWTERDPMAASQYLLEMPESTTRDHAVNGFALRLSGEDPEAAVIWAETIGDDTLRSQAITRAGQQWFRRDSEAASEWLANAGLSDEIQQAVQNPPRRRDR